MEHATDLAPAVTKSSSLLRAAADANSYFSWSKPVTSRVRITATPRVTLRPGATGNVMVKLWDVAPNGSAVMFDENVALIEKVSRVRFDLKSTDWTFEKGHQLGVQIGTIGSGSWWDTPSGNTIEVTGARLTLAVQDPQADVPTQATARRS